MLYILPTFPIFSLILLSILPTFSIPFQVFQVINFFNFLPTHLNAIISFVSCYNRTFYFLGVYSHIHFSNLMSSANTNSTSYVPVIIQLSNLKLYNFLFISFTKINGLMMYTLIYWRIPRIVLCLFLLHCCHFSTLLYIFTNFPQPLFPYYIKFCFQIV